MPTTMPTTKKFKTLYREWIVETVIDEDVEEVMHLKNLNHVDAITFKGEGSLCNGGVIRYNLGVCHDSYGKNHVRGWAYVRGGLLPDYFTDSNGFIVSKVPAKFHQELEVLKKRLHLYWVGHSVKVGA